MKFHQHTIYPESTLNLCIFWYICFCDPTQLLFVCFEVNWVFLSRNNPVFQRCYSSPFTCGTVFSTAKCKKKNRSLGYLPEENSASLRCLCYYFSRMNSYNRSRVAAGGGIRHQHRPQSCQATCSAESHTFEKMAFDFYPSSFSSSNR